MKEFLREYRLLLVILALVFSILTIKPNFSEGVKIVGVSTPASDCVSVGSVLNRVDNTPISNLSDYNSVISSIQSSAPVRFHTTTEVIPYLYYTQETCAFITSSVGNRTYTGVRVDEISPVNFEFGTEIVGGVKVLLKPEKELTPDEVELTKNVLNERLNVYGLKEIPIYYVKDFSGNPFFRIEFAGIGEEQVISLLEDEGVFEAKIGDEIVFTGNDIKSICVSGVECSAIVTPVGDASGTLFYRYSLEIKLSEDGAKKFANATSKLSEVGAGPDCQLNETINFFIDSIPMDGGQLSISCALKGIAETSPVISGSEGTQEEAFKEMKRMQALLQSTKLPVKLNMVRTESISSSLGSAFTSNIIVVFLLSILVVDLVIAIRYKTLKIVIPIVAITLSEIVITLGVASALKWTIDFAAIAGIIASVGTGVSDQIIMTDEVIRGEKNIQVRHKIKKAFFIIVASFITSLATMLPLAFAGAGILRGFAITTIIATSVGILITRPAYGRLAEIMLKG